MRIRLCDLKGYLEWDLKTHVCFFFVKCSGRINLPNQTDKVVLVGKNEALITEDFNTILIIPGVGRSFA